MSDHTTAKVLSGFYTFTIHGSYYRGSSAQAVESIDDLLIEILLRLPFISIIISKSVSKRWLSILTDPVFTKRHRTQIPKLDPPSGLYVEQPGSSSMYNFVPLDIRIPVTKTLRNLIFPLIDRQLMILRSCHGLLLCKQIRSDCDCYYVYNPTTNLFKKLPPCDSAPPGTMKMTYDPTKSPHYKLVYAKVEYSDYVAVCRIRIHTYSSETGNWTDCGNGYWSKLNVTNFKYGIYWSNAIHWVESSNHNKLNLENLAITSVQVPRVTVEWKMCWDHKLFESRGCLVLVCAYAHYYTYYFRQFYVYEMSNEHSEWSIKYFVTLDDVMRSFPEILTRPDKWLSPSVWCVVLGERDEDSFLVFELYGKVMQYNIISKAIRELHDFKSIDQHPRSFQFIASFAAV